MTLAATIISKQVKVAVEIERVHERSFSFNDSFGQEPEDAEEEEELNNNKLVLDLNNQLFESELDNIEQQSPILERELLNTEYELENFKSRLAMTETVSAVTQSVLEEIRSEYNLPDLADEITATTATTTTSAEESQRVKLESYTEMDSSDDEFCVEPHHVDEVVGMSQDEDSACDAVDAFRRETRGQIGRIVMVQEEGDDGEELLPENETFLSSSAAENDDLLLAEIRKLSLSQTRLISGDDSDSLVQPTMSSVTTEDLSQNSGEAIRKNSTRYRTFDTASSSDEDEVTDVVKVVGKHRSSVTKHATIMPVIKYSSGEVSSGSFQEMVDANKSSVSNSSLVEEASCLADRDG